jgi:hypothetical protein
VGPTVAWRDQHALDVYQRMGRVLDRLDPLCGRQHVDPRGAGGLLSMVSTKLEAAPAQELEAPVVGTFADTWPTLSVEVRRDVAGALLTSVRVRQDDTGEILTRWGEPSRELHDVPSRWPLCGWDESGCFPRRCLRICAWPGAHAGVDALAK